MKTLSVFFLIAAIVVAPSLSAQEFKVNLESSTVKWDARKTSGSGHYGLVNIQEGSLKIANNKIESAKIIVDLTTIINTDGEGGASNDRLIRHLKSDDFFNVEEFPKAEFILTGSSEFENNEAKVYGRLTFRGKTHPITFIAKKDDKVFTTKISVDRSIYGIDYGLAKKMIEKEFTLEVKLALETKD